MNNEKQRIAIAEACGIVSQDQWGTLYKTPRGILRDCPDYLTDLNAMHEAEEILDAIQCAEYARQLMKHHPTYCVTVLDTRFAPTEEIAYETYQLLHATAAQKAEALLRTFNKWTD